MLIYCCCVDDLLYAYLVEAVADKKTNNHKYYIVYSSHLSKKFRKGLHFSQVLVMSSLVFRYQDTLTTKNNRHNRI